MIQTIIILITGITIGLGIAYYYSFQKDDEGWDWFKEHYLNLYKKLLSKSIKKNIH